ncbi:MULTISPECIES: alpha/beta hydrolase [unclassified Micromonospora]|uniref:alpha/beta hydrolase n=1 Tax=unclassified Micromonospora TaxID=2617518 RepID=UPI0033A0CA4E
MLHGRSVPAAPVFALGDDDTTGRWARYNWANYLARSGFRVFIMDLQGSGLSTRSPQMDVACNAFKGDQSKLAPYPLPTGACDEDYPFPRYLNQVETDLAELHAVISWIRGTAGVQKVNLVGHSAAAHIVGPYVMKWPDWVESLFLLAPIFPPYGLGDRPPFMPPPEPPVPYPLPPLPDRFRCPMFITSRDQFMADWNAEAPQRETGIEDFVWNEIMKLDPVGATWGSQGVIRWRNSAWYGWTKSKVESNDALGVSVPVAIVYGTSDQQINQLSSTLPSVPSDTQKPGPPFSVEWLFRAIPGDRKLMVSIDKTGHFMPWETQHYVLHRYSADWIRNKSIDWQNSGAWQRDTYGQLVPVAV